ncbi:MAG: HAMP domain-containing histidine kinase [Thermodesulfovibrionales bacterium]|nr:HAMP domain-containing histidine kinase [Thermodesulfovibrionales bacterium]
MTDKLQQQERVDFILGEEIPIEQIIKAANLTSLLKSVGSESVAISDTHGNIIISEGYQKGTNQIPTLIMSSIKAMIYKGKDWLAEDIYYEGEIVGYLILQFKEEDIRLFEIVLKVLSASLKTIIFNTSKRLLTTELHTNTVKRSYEELVAMYSDLVKSEKRYRELSETLEQKVEERTRELKQAHMTMIQKEKMASVGQLAAGIAHEINNPISYIISNLNALKKYIMSFDEIIRLFQMQAKEDKAVIEAYKRLKIDIKLYDSVEIIKQCLSGAERIKKIVDDIKGFSHIDDAELRDVDINEEIDKTISVLAYEIRSRNASIEKRLCSLPKIHSNPNLIAQVLLNLILNALQSKPSGVNVVITSNVKDNNIVISIKDDGSGISDDIKTRIFEPFFTTKDVGTGKGLGLSIVYDIITSMNGSVYFHSEVGKGTEFFVTIPIKGDVHG